MVVVGGGVIGLSVAWRVQETGRSVVVVDPDPGHGSSWAAAGMLAPIGEAHFGEGPLIDLNVAAARAWPSFAGDLEAASERPVGLRREGALLVALDPSDAAAVHQLCDFQQRSGLAAEPRSRAQCRELEPLLAPSIQGGVELAHDDSVDNRLLIEALIAACAHTGVERIAHEVTALCRQHDRVTGVVLQDGRRLDAEAVVVAAGARSSMLAGLGATDVPPVRPVRGVTLRLRIPADVAAPRRTVRGLVHGRPVYVVPRHDDRVVIGATMEERGFATDVTAGAIFALLHDARSLLPVVDEYIVEESICGLRPGSPDNGPIVGPTTTQGLFMATGHYRNGILQAPLTAAEITANLDGATTGHFTHFGPTRWSTS